ncbi:MAG: TlpA disulfide reductase family protein [Bacteroidota bacterium]
MNLSMLKFFLGGCLLGMFLVNQLSAQDGSSIPSTELETMNGKKINTQDLGNDGKPFIINFWATWCHPCLEELDAIAEVYEDWIDETGVKLIAISIDNARSAVHVRSNVFSRNWEYEVYLDKNSEFKRLMNVVTPPHTFLVDGEGNIVYQKGDYKPGDEDVLYEKLLKLTEGK